MTQPGSNHLDETSTATSATGKLTGRHWLIFSVITFVLLTDGMDVTIVSHVFPSLVKEWGVSVGGGIAVVVTGGALAMGLGALIAGRLADLLGRKSVLVAAGVLCSAGTAIGASSPDFAAFIAWRLIACVGIGAVMPTGVTLLADLVPSKQRGALVAAAYAGIGLGTTAGAVLAGMILPAGGWRLLLTVAGALPLAATLLLALTVPESPRFSRGQNTHAESGKGSAGTDDYHVMGRSVRSSAVVTRQSLLSGILARQFASTTVLLWLFAFLSLGTQLLIIQYLPILLQQPVPGLTSVESSTIVAVYGFASVLGIVCLSAILTRKSRFVAIGIVLALSAATALAIGFLSNASFGVLLSVLSIAGLIIPTALGPTRNVLAAAAYPAAMRGAGVGSTEFSARTGSAVGGAVGGFLIGAGLGLGGVFLALLVPIAGLMGTLIALRLKAHSSVDAKDSVNDAPSSRSAQPGTPSGSKP
ncbi:MFS transporter, AAHS family, 4-hydroxybenzoate transporter [Pseudarthrobacter enclensis]|uniref:MFS transporter n=1 Tax=Pseudarthrobacter enclensis TaxID=993070 RepID=UPI0008157578|nr:MFS transporter [Pseudarthrobacter enclensis]SCC30355.1 MFS transporter, AAHS family, 4-hydroxybenzoate transporter [Pseudarthrobacter enclensis]